MSPKCTRRQSEQFAFMTTDIIKPGKFAGFFVRGHSHRSRFAAIMKLDGSDTVFTIL